jgi:hypothetical protein
VSQTGWDLRPFAAWVLDEYLPSLKAGPGAARYARRPGARAPDLYGTADAACILYTLGCLDTSPPEWLELLSSYQDPASGFFVAPAGVLTTAHNTGFAVGAMNLFEPELRNGELPKAPVRFGASIADPPEAERFCGILDWRDNCYEAGEILIGHASTFFNVEGVVADSWFSWLVEFVEGRKLDPSNGMVGVGKPPGGDGDQIGGTLHFDFFWQALERRLPYATQRAQAILTLQQPSGLWDENNPWWLTFDACYMLGRTIPDVSDDLAGRVREAVSRAVAVLAKRAADDATRSEDFVEPWIGAHMLTGAVSFFAYAQQVLGRNAIVTDEPLELVLDRRPYI